ncbi:GumC family protein [Gloeobacter morelensis]|uniref:non-specific protein-tyrosine kinase n=1 Tax=Gloeobacter morelensis MG652769 TaxID=2781736 RepID=A0ABY3PR09_9CYAN|nr:polysaccharide biosynthesis tyrosine autokinase [Gloeobacter morelensis]UFP95973.1 polysaccharide biosynthesis tyrosine autokinase [Gloeobacter morelensis MG652769]
MVNKATPSTSPSAFPDSGEYGRAAFDIQAYARILWRWRWPTLGVAVGTLALATAYTFLSKPVYQSEMLLLLEDKGSQTEVLEESVKQLGGGADFSTQISTQIQVLSSRPLVNKALLGLRGRYPELQEQDADDVIKRLNVSQITRTQVVTVAFKDNDPRLVEAMLNNLAQIYIDYSQEVQKSKVSGAISFIEAELPRVRRTVEESEEALRDFRRQNNILDPQEQGRELSRILSGLTEDTEKARVELQTARERYAGLTGRLGTSPGSALASATLSGDKLYQDLLKQLQETETQLAVESTRFRDDYPTVQALKDKRDKLQRQLTGQAEVLLGGGRQTGAPMSSLRDSLAGPAAAQGGGTDVNDRYGELQQTLTGELLQAENLYRVQSARVAGLESARSRLAERFQLVPNQAKRYQELNRNAVISSESLNRLLQRLQELKIQAAQEISPWRVIEPAMLPELDKPIWPKPLITIGIGGFLGLALGLLAATLLEAFDDRVKTIDRAKELLRLPLLAAIPYSQELDNTAAVQGTGDAPAKKGDRPRRRGDSSDAPYSRSPSKEAFRSLLTNLRFLSSDRKMNVFVISSSAPGEGKSTVSTNMARVAGELNRRVLIIDADLRRPTVAKRLELSNSRGLSSVLSGEMRWQDVVQSPAENVYAITSGPIPPNPVMLLDSKRMAELVAQWRTEFDLVVIDSPPLIGLTDTTLLTKYADGLLMVVGLETARRGGLKGAIERLAAAQIVPVGMVANALRQESEGQYYYYQYYYHYYGEPVPGKEGPAAVEKKGWLRRFQK